MGESSIAMEVDEDNSKEISSEGEMVVLKNSIVELKLPESELRRKEISCIFSLTKDIFKNFYLYGNNTKNKPILVIVYNARVQHVLEWPKNYWKIYAHNHKYKLWSINMKMKPEETSIKGCLMDTIAQILPLLIHVEKGNDGDVFVYGRNFQGAWGAICVDKLVVPEFEDELQDIFLFEKRS